MLMYEPCISNDLVLHLISDCEDTETNAQHVAIILHNLLH